MISQLQPSTFAEFQRQLNRGNVVAVTRTIADAFVHPVDAFVSVAGAATYAFLFESVEGKESVAKYSFLGADPYLIVRGRGELTTIERNGRIEMLHECVPDFLRRHFSKNKLADAAGGGPLAGGADGFLGYGAANWFEPALNRAAAVQPQTAAANPQTDEALLMFYRTLVTFDHVQQKTRIVSVVFTDEARGDQLRLEKLYDAAVRETEQIERQLRSFSSPSSSDDSFSKRDRTFASDELAARTSVRSNWSREGFQRAVREVKEHILAGDCYQVVLSQRFMTSTTADAVAIYSALRRSNPAPYTYLLRLGRESIIGASPEMLVRCRDRELNYRPIAGTRPRGVNAIEDAQLAEEMQNDEKEVAEHMMLVDLGRNDLGRVAEFGSVAVDELLTVERYSRVQHLVSSLRARLRDGYDRFDALAACFPAGTVSGAPKVRAMEIIRELEPDSRGVYAGAILYVDYAGNLDSCIAIRTIVLKEGEAAVQAGAGIVADSVPEREYEETVHKAGALFRAIEMAEAEEY
jgi:anthranilate synthase component 1